MRLAIPAITRVVRQRKAEVDYCYRRLARTHGYRAGRVTVSFDVTPHGRIEDLDIEAPSFAGTELPTCMRRRLSRWRFPESPRGAVDISYPFVFVASG